MIMNEERVNKKLKELKLKLIMTAGHKGNLQQSKNIKKEIARIKTKQRMGELSPEDLE